MQKKLKFEVFCVLGILIRTTVDHWNTITKEKHLEIYNKEKEIVSALTDPCEIRKSSKDKNVYLYYIKIGKYYYCAVARHLNGEGFLITAYLTNNLKEGEIV